VNGEGKKPTSLWRGRPITELTREELIGALEQVSRLLDAERRQRLTDIANEAIFGSTKGRFYP